jgi:fumarylacetoacetase
LQSLPSSTVEACGSSRLNAVMALGRENWTPLRALLSDLLSAGHREVVRNERNLSRCLLAMADVTMQKPALIGDYTDFYASIDHATNVGRLFRPDNPLLPNYKYVPIGYHGRASSICLSGARVRRPSGQMLVGDGVGPQFSSTAALDYEVEIGFFVGPGNRQGEAIPIAEAGDHLFGVCLLNDWSARDLQAWEYQPLGPFLAKSFATSISPWVVTTEALEPFRTAALLRAVGDPAPLGYLNAEADQRAGGIELTVEVFLRSARMREAGMDALRLSRGSLAELYWTPAQLLAHHASNGCNLQPGDLLGSGTVSGPRDDSLGCLLEITQRGRVRIALPTGETRGYLEDGDEITLRGYCERSGFVGIGLGECTSRITS